MKTINIFYLQLCFGWVLAYGPEDGAQLLGVDDAVPVGVEPAEGVLELSDLFLSQALVGAQRHNMLYSPQGRKSFLKSMQMPLRKPILAD